MKLKSLLAGAIALVLSTVPALAQTSPNWTYKYVPTTAEWNNAFASKQDVLGYTPLNTAGGVMTGKLVTAAPSATTAGFNLAPGTPPASPVNGDIWFTSTGLFMRVNGQTIGPALTPSNLFLTIGTTPIQNGTTGQILYDNGGAVGELPTTGSGNVVRATSPTIGSPTFTGTVTGAGTIPNNVLANSTLKLGSTTLTLGATTTNIAGLTLASPVLSGTVSGAGTIPNAVLANSAVTVNGVSCVLGATCSITATAASVTVGTTSILGGASGSILFDNAGTLGELATTGSGNVVRATSPAIASPTFSGTVAGAGTVPNAVLVNSTMTVNGTTCTLGASCTPASPLNIGASIVNSGTNGFILYNNAGVLDNKATTGTGNVVQATSPTINSPTLLTPTLGVASATTINKVTITTPATGSTLTIANGKTLTASNTLTFTGTDGTSFAFPGSSDTVAGLAAAQTLTNKVVNCANNTCTVRAASDITGLLPLANGGLNANLTASNGGVFYSTASAGAILAGTANANRPLVSGSSTAPSWGAFSLPTSVVSGGVPYFDSTSTMMSSARLESSRLVIGGGPGNPPVTLLSLGTSTTVLHGNASGAPTFGAVSLTADVSGVLPLANGGTNNGSITPSNGGIVYSTASGFDVLASTSTAGLCVLSQANSPPVWGSCSGAAAVSSVSNSDGSITVSPTTGAVVVSLAANSVVKSVNSLVNAVNITAGTGIATVTPSGQNIPISIDAATNADWTGASANKVMTPGVIWSAAGLLSSTVTTSYTPNFATGLNFFLTTTSGTNFTLQNPTNPKPGQTGCLYIQQSSGTPSSITFGTNWITPGGVSGLNLAQAATGITRLCYFVITSSAIDFTMDTRFLQH